VVVETFVRIVSTFRVQLALRTAAYAIRGQKDHNLFPQESLRQSLFSVTSFSQIEERRNDEASFIPIKCAKISSLDYPDAGSLIAASLSICPATR
jgi:hypothetical protein